MSYVLGAGAGNRAWAKLLAGLAALGALWAIAAFATCGDAARLLRARGVSDYLSGPADVVIMELQAERQLTASWLGAARTRSGAERQTRLAAQRARTDAARLALRRSAGSTRARWAAGDSARERVDLLLDRLSRLPSIRASVDGNQLDRKNMASEYTGIIDVAFQIYRTPRVWGQADLSRREESLLALSRAREVLAQEDALVHGALAAGGMTTVERERLGHLVGARRFLHTDVLATVNSADLRRYREMASDPTFATLRALEDRLVRAPAARTAVTESDWAKPTEWVLDGLRQVTAAGAQEVAEDAAPSDVITIVRAGLVLGLGIIAVIAVFVLALRTRRTSTAALLSTTMSDIPAPALASSTLVETETGQAGAAPPDVVTPEAPLCDDTLVDPLRSQSQPAGLAPHAGGLEANAPEDSKPNASAPVADEPHDDESSTEQPTTETANTNEPTTETPSIDQPATEAPSEPTTETPNEPPTETPTTDEPPTETPNKPTTERPDSDLVGAPELSGENEPVNPPPTTIAGTFPKTSGAEVPDLRQGLRFGKVSDNQSNLDAELYALLLELNQRNQSLLHQQLRVLDSLELREVDDGNLGELFQADHLATRVRRNVEKLIALTGGVPGRRWRNPVPMVDVVRAAIAEVPDYPRIAAAELEPSALVGPAVTDVSHLLAELMENATAFAPTDSSVQINGTADAAGYTVTVTDAGPGMSPDDLIRANQVVRCSTAPTGGGWRGLYAAGRLADRHGITIDLCNADSGGLAAKVVMPSHLISAPANSSTVADVDADLGAGSTQGTASVTGVANNVRRTASGLPTRARNATIVPPLPGGRTRRTATEETSDRVARLRKRVKGSTETGELPVTPGGPEPVGLDKQSTVGQPIRESL